MSIKVDLDGKRKPRGNANMHEAELAMEKIEVQAQTFTPGTDKTGPILSVCKLKAELLVVIILFQLKPN